MYASFPAHFGWRMYCSNAVKHGSAKLCCTSTLISEKSVTGRNLGPGSRCHKKTLRAGQQPLAELQNGTKNLRVSTRIKRHQRPKHLLCVEVSIFVDSLGRAAGMRPAAPESQVQMMQQDATRSHTQIQRPYRLFSNLDVPVNMKNGCTNVAPIQRIYEQRPTEPSILTVNFRVFFVPVTTPHGSIDVLMGSATGSTLDDPPIDV